MQEKNTAIHETQFTPSAMSMNIPRWPVFYEQYNDAKKPCMFMSESWGNQYNSFDHSKRIISIKHIIS